MAHTDMETGKSRRVLLDEEDQIRQIQAATQEQPMTTATTTTATEELLRPRLPGFFSPQTTQLRRKFIIQFAWIDLLFVTIILGILSLYWGALASISHNTDVFTVGIVDFDHGMLGQAVTQFAHNYTAVPPTLRLTYPSSTDFGNVPTRVPPAVLNEDLWVAIVIEPGASQKLTTPGFDPTDAISIYYAEARSSSLITSLVLPYVNQLMLSMMVAIPIPFAYTMYDLAPTTPLVGIASTQIGLIFLMILSFFAVLFMLPVHAMWQGNIRTRDYITYRCVTPVLNYFLLSLLYTLLSIIWGVQMDKFYGAAGFVIYWMLSWLGMMAMGVAIENVNVVGGLLWTPVFLIFWVISNVSTGFFPIEALSNFYKWGYAWPFYHMSKGGLTVTIFAGGAK